MRKGIAARTYTLWMFCCCCCWWKLIRLKYWDARNWSATKQLASLADHIWSKHVDSTCFDQIWFSINPGAINRLATQIAKELGETEAKLKWVRDFIITNESSLGVVKKWVKFDKQWVIINYCQNTSGTNPSASAYWASWRKCTYSCRCFTLSRC